MPLSVRRNDYNISEHVGQRTRPCGRCGWIPLEVDQQSRDGQIDRTDMQGIHCNRQGITPNGTGVRRSEVGQSVGDGHRGVEDLTRWRTLRVVGAVHQKKCVNRSVVRAVVPTTD